MDLPERWQSIAPASDEPGQQRLAPDSKRRRQAVPVACVQCRGGKAKCDGARPRCSRCQANDLVCQYDVAEGVSRAERMKLLKKDTLARKVEGLERIIDFLRSRSDNEAATVLARLRLGDRVEDVIDSLPMARSSSSYNPPNLSTQDSVESSISSASHSSVRTGETTASRMHESVATASLTSASERRTSEPFTTSGKGKAKGKGKHQAILDKLDESPFLSPLFDRQDLLLPGNDDENDDDADTDADSNIDPRLLDSISTLEHSIISPCSHMNISRSTMPSPFQIDSGTLPNVTRLHGRQPMVDTIRIHPNLDLRNLFGNMPLSSSIRANNYSASIQDTQVTNLSLPTWAMTCVNTRPDPGSLKHAFPHILRDATELIQRGMPVGLVIETHPNIAALFDPAEFERSGILSRWAASMVHSIKMKGNDFTCFASMYLFWYVMRWMIYPSPDTYTAMPEWLRPTPNQLFMPHINILDYVIWPAFRELAVEMPSMQERMSWLMDMSLTVRCDWWSSPDEAIRRDDITKLWDLCPAAQQAMRDLSNWSVGPSIRGYVNNADSYVRIRTEEY